MYRKNWIYLLLLSYLFCLPIQAAKLTTIHSNKPDHSYDFGSLPDSLKYEKLLQTYLRKKLWLESEAYDACHVLMVPMHVAFAVRNDWIDDFTHHIHCFLGASSGEIAQGRLNRLHYYYFLSRYLALHSRRCNTQQDLRLFHLLFAEVERLWLQAPAWQWGRSPYPSMRERVLAKLSTIHPKKSYYRAIIDEENFLFAISADLVTYLRQTERKNDSVLNDILQVTWKVYNQEVVYSALHDSDTWLFQPGVWRDHPEYLYSGTLTKGLPPNDIKKAIATDTSHSARMPLWLTSFYEASGNATRKKYYKRLLHGLDKQFCEKVLVLPDDSFPAVRTTNYLDGSNGLYRYQYSTMGKGDGYGPYELSGTFLLGWWSFLKSEKIAAAYETQLSSFPLSRSIVALYTGPNTSRERNSLTTWPDFFTNGLAELLCTLSVINSTVSIDNAEKP